jgi:phospholipid/cholesterol/gamma-HCH transport system permease protein
VASGERQRKAASVQSDAAPGAVLSFVLDGEAGRLEARGDWTIARAAEIDRALRALPPLRPGLRSIEIVVDQDARIDTSGAWLLLRTKDAFEASGVPTLFRGLAGDRTTLVEAVAQRRFGAAPPPPPRPGVVDAVAATGAAARGAVREAVDVLDFLGRTARGLGRVLRDPRRLRFASVVTHIQRAGLEALPIVSLMSFLVGAIIAQQGAYQLRPYGAQTLAVSLVGILILREIGLLLAAIMFAGRSGSAFTAEIGAMKMREEIDAMRVIGLDAVEVLVLPRLLALVVALPIVAMVSNVAALAGGLVACWLYLDMSPTTYLQLLRDAVTVAQLKVGLVKAPFMAVVIATIACIEGFRVAGSTESLGLHTTAAVVKAIFMVIVMDGLFAILFAEIGM